MALIFMESFDHREPAGRGVAYQGNRSYVAGRVGGYGIKSADYGALYTSIPVANLTTVWASMAFKRSTATLGAGAIEFLTADATRTHGSVVLNPSHTLSIQDSANNVRATSVAQISPTGWNRLDVRITALDQGSMEVWLDGNKVVEVNHDFLNQFNASPIGVVRISHGNLDGITVDDVYLTDTTGPAPYNTRLPDLRIETIVPAGDGSASQLAGSDGDKIANWQLIDEMPTSTTDYVTSSTEGERDLYSFSDLLTTTGQVWGVQVHVNANKTDAGMASVAPLTKVAATERKQAMVGLSTSPNWVSGAIQTVDPSDNPWTVAAVNAAEFGVEVG